MSHWYCFNCILVVLNIFWKACTHLIITLREASSWLIKPFYNVFKTFQENVFHESATDLYATSYKRFFWSFFRRLDLTEKRRFLWTLFAKSCKTRCLVHKKRFLDVFLIFLISDLCKQIDGKLSNVTWMLLYKTIE